MSFPPGQYPQQPNPYGYHPMGYYAHDPSALLGPARWTCGLMIALGVVLLLMAGCIGVMAAAISMPEVWEAMEKEMQNNPQISQYPAGDLQGIFKLVFIVFAAVGGIGGLLAIAFGIWSRNGSRGGIIASLVFVIFTALGSVVMSITSLPEGLCMFGIPLVLSICILILCIKALGNAKQIDALNAQYQLAWQQQQMYAYDQGRGGTPQ